MPEMSFLCSGFFSRSLRKTEKERRKLFLENGSLLLKELIASSDGKYNPFRNYSEEEINYATNNFDPSFVFKCNNNIRGDWYRGTIEGRVVSICKSKIDAFPYPNISNNIREAIVREACRSAVTDVSISAMLSGHRNVLKLLGCCLETTVPTMVCEYVGKVSLLERIHPTTGSDSQPLSWKSRLEIAGQIAYAIAYLHTAFAKPIIHRLIRPWNIFQDQNDVVKLTDFSHSFIIHKRDTEWMDERLDVRSFGSLLLELLTGKGPWELHELATGNDSTVFCYEDCDSENHIKDYLSCHSIEDIVDPAFFLPEGGGGSEQQQLHQWEAVKELAVKCKADLPLEETITMVEVTKQLREIQLS